MVKSRVFSYKKIIVLENQRMQELRDLLLKHCDRITFQAITANKAEITFESFDELMEFSNFGDDKIVSLSLWCYAPNEYSYKIKIEFSSQDPFHNETMRCQYNFSNTDEESILISDLQKFLEKSTAYNTAYKICEWASYFFFIVLGILPIYFPVNGKAIYKLLSGKGYLFVFVFITEFISYAGLYHLFKKQILKRVYPRVIYAWGEEEKRFNELKALRSNLFWGVFVAIVINIVVGILLKKAMG